MKLLWIGKAADGSDGGDEIDLLAVIVRCFSREMVEALGEKDIRTEKSCDWGAF